MITNYEPLILIGIICIASLANIKLSSKIKLDIVFFLQSILFMWFTFHFIHSVF
ncbi:virulence factor [Deerpox virus W-1170-84]|uniref:Virulence factor n=2 Tax=Mule deerpox virus TaxID=304399 RepID=Q08FN7_DPV83|nr:Virulence factor [Deerpox virus W-848-83]ABI99099.1 virulence factor [Deerpox virus W-1170-84]ABI99270.1 virulence factor [Deerpox virus W-848-83]AUI80676.1 virulence factor [White-tailed deer poxvirus]AYC44786.1 virulence factor [Moosepox virus GoldyGopher14]